MNPQDRFKVFDPLRAKGKDTPWACVLDVGDKVLLEGPMIPVSAAQDSATKLWHPGMRAAFVAPRRMSAWSAIYCVGDGSEFRLHPCKRELDQGDTLTLTAVFTDLPVVMPMPSEDWPEPEGAF